MSRKRSKTKPDSQGLTDKKSVNQEGAEGDQQSSTESAENVDAQKNVSEHSTSQAVPQSPEPTQGDGQPPGQPESTITPIRPLMEESMPEATSDQKSPAKDDSNIKADAHDDNAHIADQDRPTETTPDTATPADVCGPAADPQRETGATSSEDSAEHGVKSSNPRQDKPPAAQSDRASWNELPSSTGETLLFLCVAALMAASVFRATPLQSANDRSRWATVWSLVERGTYQIDEIDQHKRFSTIDKVRHRTNETEPWHFYSSKPPLLSTMVAGLYWLERVTLGFGLFGNTDFVIRLLLSFVNLLPMLLALASFMQSLRLLKFSEHSRLFMLAVIGLGSMLNPYVTTLNNHTPAAVCVVFCLSAMIRMQVDRIAKRRCGSDDFIILGINAAFASCFELPSALFGVLCFLFAMKKSYSRTLSHFVPAAVIPLAAFFITNWICTGGLKPFYMYYGTEKYVYVHEGIASYWSQPRGMDANNESWPVYLFHCVLGHHGIVSLSPILLLIIPGWFVGVREPVKAQAMSGDQLVEWQWRVLSPVFRQGLFLTVVTLGFYLSRTQNYNYGGNTAALRWVLWLTPFWWFAILPGVTHAIDTRKKLTLLYLLLFCSIISSQWSIDRPWRPSWLFHSMEDLGLVNYQTQG
ncbi:MAG: hypothetical protein KDA91_07950 [Planctomycetaceae bacterium]|nr:hypothetical protein [Planctomycetaceae bacterium]